jgi:outer membrane protein insertion porin family
MRVPHCYSWPFVRTVLALAAACLCCMACLGQDAGSSGDRGKIADVIVQGNRVVSTQQIVGMLKTRVGMDYNAETVQEDVRTLYATRQYKDVHVDQVNLPDGRVKVIFTIRDYPNVVEKIIYHGNKHMSPEDLNTLTGLRLDSPLNPITNKKACQLITQKYNEVGRPFASCELVRGGNDGDTVVEFNITEGPEVGIKAIDFTGNTFVSAAVLRTHLMSWAPVVPEIGLIRHDFNQGTADSDVLKLVEYYRNFGFQDVRVARQLQWEPDGRLVTIIFHIQEGPRYRLKDAPQVVNVKAYPVEAIQRLLTSKAGDIYDGQTITKDKKSIENYYGYDGRFVKVREDAVFSKDTPGLVTVQYVVEEKPPARVGEIEIIGNTRTKMNVIMRHLLFYPGQVLSYPDLRLSEKELAKLGIFKNSPDGAVHPTITVLDEDSDSVYKKILVQVDEDNTGSFILGAGVTSDAGLTGSIVLNERNFDIFNPPNIFSPDTVIDDILNGRAWRGAGQELRLEAVPGTELQRYSVTLREPSLFDSLFSFTVSGYYYERQYDEYDENRIGGRFAFGRQLNKYWSAAVACRVENIGVYDIAAPTESLTPPVDYTSVAGKNFLVGVKESVTRDTRDSYLRPTQGDVLEISTEECFGSATFPLFNVDFNKYFTLFQRNDNTGKHVLAFHSEFGWAGDDTPVYERFFGGGFRSIRGFQFRGVGPNVDGYMVGGDFMFLNSLEYQIPLTAKDQVYAVTFLDSGTVESRINEWTDYRVSAGFGLRFVIPMMGPVPIALDFGFPIVKSSTDRNQLFSFYLGFYKF